MTFQTQVIEYLNEVGVYIKDNYGVKCEICHDVGDLWLGVGLDFEVRCIPHVEARKSEYFVKRYFDKKGYYLGKFRWDGVMCLIEAKIFDSGIIDDYNDNLWWDYPVGSHQSD